MAYTRVMDDRLTYCGDIVHRHDPDRFLVTLKMKPDVRPALWALYAFNHEIAKTREVVSDTTIGHIRLQWWRDALAKIYDDGTVLQNETLTALYEAIQTYDLPRDLFEALVYAREFDLENIAPASLDGLEHYTDFTNTPLLKLCLRITGEDEREETIRSIAMAYGMTGLMRAAVYHKAQGRSYMPSDLGDNAGAVIGPRACEFLHVAPQSRLLKAHKRLCQLYLGQIRRVGYDPFSPQLSAPPPFFHLRFALEPL